MADWTRDYFERGYAERWGLRAPNDQVRAEAAGIHDLLSLSPAVRVVDLGCGHGRHALAMAERGVRVVGLDTSRALLSRARELAAEASTPARWVRADMRSLPFRESAFDAALIMDAFGFFETEDEDLAVLVEVATALRCGGRLLMKIVNGELVMNDPRLVDREERDGQVVDIARSMSGRTMTEHITISGARGGGEYRRQQRLYRSSEMTERLAAAGVTVSSVYSSHDGATFDPATSERMWIVGTRR